MFTDGRDVMLLIEHLIDEFRAENGVKPAGIVLGPKEYVLLCKYFSTSTQHKHLRDSMVVGMISTVNGYPIHVKETYGVDLLISYEHAWKP